MGLSNENKPTMTKPTNVQGGARNNRRALSSINQNLVGANQYPCVVNKRVLSKDNAICNVNPVIPAHRPITRRFAAQIASSQQQHCPEETKKAKIAAADFSVLEDETKDQPVPMSLEQTETSFQDNSQMEIEMEDIFEECAIDIDSEDAKNSLAVAEYVEDLYGYYSKMEACSLVTPDYMEQQPDINERMRSILIDWLIEVHHKFDLREETLFLTVNLIDRFLEKQNVVRKKLQLVGLVALLLACKYEEVSLPVIDDLVFISDKAYARKEVLELEKLVLNTLQFNMSVPTAYVFMRRFLKAAQSDKKLELLSFFLIELCLVEYQMLKFPPSFIAAAAIYTAQCTLYGVKQWTKTCELHTKYSEDQLLDCSRLIVGLHQKASKGKLTGAHRKYNTSKFGYAAKSEPAHFLLEQTQ